MKSDVVNRLAPTSFKKGDERAKAAGHKGGSVKSARKKLAAKLRSWRDNLSDKTITDKQFEWLLIQVQDPEAMSLNLLSKIQEVSQQPEVLEDPDLHIKCVQLYNSAFKTLHGERIKVMSVNLNMDIKQEAEEEIDAYLKKVLDHEI